MNAVNAVMALRGLLLALGAFLFWLWMLIDCVTKESNQGNDRLGLGCDHHLHPHYRSTHLLVRQAAATVC
jgi:hypothetical protein